MQEQVVLVDTNGKKIGTALKSEVHSSKTPLHLAFSCYLFNSRGDFLLTQRAKTKKVWPGVWTNSVCGHLMPDESTAQAIARRAKFELGLNKLHKLKVILPDYRYKTPPFNGIIENEICPVFVALVGSEIKPNPEEVEDYKWLAWDEVTSAVSIEPSIYSWWFKDQLKKLETSESFTKFLSNFS